MNVAFFPIASAACRHGDIVGRIYTSITGTADTGLATECGLWRKSPGGR